ncbi:MAG TPA: glycerol kinase GlpK [Puia sp.]|jgi:glycerol kinase
MPEFILSLDQGTTSSRAIVFDRRGNPVAIAQKEFSQIFPRPGWVEHDPFEIWSTQLAVAVEAVAKAALRPDDVVAMGITNQRETAIVWNRATGKPVYNAIVWQDRRTSDYCNELKEAGKEGLIRQRTGLVIDAYFSATKVRWILDHVPGVRELAEEGLLAFGTVDSWLLWNLTGGAVHATDVTNASRTMLFNIHTMQWDEELLKLFGIPAGLLPRVCASSEVYGYADEQVWGARTPIAGIAGDQQSALFGQMCTEAGMVKNTYGTGCFLLMNIGGRPIVSKNNLVTTVAWKINGEVSYALEGSIFIGGAVVQWLRDGLGIIDSSAEVEEMAGSVADNGGVYMVPAFTGLGAPHWQQEARGMITGITRGTTAAHLSRAALESIAFQTLEVVRAMEADAGAVLRELRVDGGAVVNNLLMQFQSDIIGVKVVRPALTETTAMGAAYLAGLAVGFWKDLEEIQSLWKVGRCFDPCGDGSPDHLVRGWSQAVGACKNLSSY